MLHRKVYQLSREGKDVWIYLRDQGRWLERARILDIEGDTVLVRYETEDDEEICSWEEIVRLDSIGAVAQRLSTIPKGPLSPAELLVADDCPEAEMITIKKTEENNEDPRLGDDFHPVVDLICPSEDHPPSNKSEKLP
jgi:hypothetical protein